jgi:hypothetical protein
MGKIVRDLFLSGRGTSLLAATSRLALGFFPLPVSFPESEVFTA